MHSTGNAKVLDPVQYPQIAYLWETGFETGHQCTTENESMKKMPSVLLAHISTVQHNYYEFLEAIALHSTLHY